MTTVFIDESGYTGADLLNADQPVFVMSSHSIPEQACQDLIDAHFPSRPAGELKFSRLSRSPRTQPKLIELLGALSSQPGEVRVSVTHKRYALTAKMIDILVETAAHETGFDLYDRGANIAFTNLLHTVLPVFGGADFFDAILQRFQRMMRTRTIESYNAFFALLNEQTEPPQLVDLLEYFLIFDLLLGPDALPDDDLLDVTMSSGIVLLDAWRKSIQGDAEVVADESKRILQERRFWDDLNNPALPRRTIGHDRRTIDIPILFDAIRLGRSEHFAGLQLADLVAGATGRVAGIATRATGSQTEFDRELSTIVEPWLASLTWPSADLSPESLGTIGPNYEPAADALTEIYLRGT